VQKPSKSGQLTAKPTTLRASRWCLISAQPTRSITSSQHADAVMQKPKRIRGVVEISSAARTSQKRNARHAIANKTPTCVPAAVVFKHRTQLSHILLCITLCALVSTTRPPASSAIHTSPRGRYLTSDPSSDF